jgi:putative SOS response-associated peptidase YedK
MAAESSLGCVLTRAGLRWRVSRAVIFGFLRPKAKTPSQRAKKSIVFTPGSAAIVSTSGEPGKSRRPIISYVAHLRNLESPFWRSTLANPQYRCLVPVTDFCEWSGEKGSKQEHWLSVPTSPVFSFGGIWRPTAEGNCHAFLTCEPNPHVAPIHPKAMPLIVPPEDYDAWLDGEVERACALAQPFTSQLMVVA